MLRRALRGLVMAALLLGLAFAARAQSFVATTGTGSWVSTAGHASAGVVCDDCVSGELPLGFTFSLGGVNYTTARISSNGRVQFNNAANDYSGGQYPNASTVRTLAAGYRDLHPGNGGSVTYATVGTAPNRQFVASWTNVPLYGNTAVRVNFQVLVNEGGSFVYQYGAMGSSVYIGYQVTTSDYSVYSTAAAPASGTAIRWGPASSRLSGTVFEDLNYGGGAGRSLATAGGVARSGATVELYNASGAFVSSTSTAADGSYGFTVSSSGTYYVRAASPTVSSSRAGSTSSLRAVLTYRTTAASGSAVAVTDHVGGTNPAATDPGVATAGAVFNTGTFVYSAGLSGTAQAVTPVAVTLGASVSGLDFGFNFSTVTNINDSGAGSLRQAITNANTLGGDASLAQSGRSAGVEHVVFMIPNGTASAGLRSSLNHFSSGVATIRPASALPTVSAQLVLDARLQPGWTGTPVVELDGSNAGSGVHGLLSRAAVTIGGFTINRFGGHGVQIDTVSGGYTIAGNWVGLDRTGTSASRNNGEGLSVWASPNGVVGGPSVNDRNVFSGNGNNGITIASSTSTGTLVQGNRIGTNAAGTARLSNGSVGLYVGAGSSRVVGNQISGNTFEGIQLDGAASGCAVQGNLIGLDAAGTGVIANGSLGVYIKGSGNTIGGTTAGQGNSIAGNARDGVAVVGSASGNRIQGNSFWGNGGLAIDLGDDGVSGNDGLKPTGSPNAGMDYPVITSARLRGNQLTVDGYVGSAAGQAAFGGALVEFYVRDNDASGHGEGQTWLASTTADASGNFRATLTVSTSAIAATAQLTAIATDGSGNTSEFGRAFTALVYDFVVNDNGDAADASPGDGLCLTAGGVCTLRAAIAEANALAAGGATPAIVFAIPACTAYGAAGCSIRPVTPLPTVSRAMAIDATTQSGFSTGTYSPIIELSGALAPASTIGLVVNTSGVTLRGLAINRFGSHGASLAGSGHTVTGSWFGVNALGTAAAGNGGNGLYVTASSSTFGGTAAGEGNVFSGNTLSGLALAGSGNRVLGSVAGLLPNGSTVAANQLDGITVTAASQTLGGSATGAGNTLSGNGRSGVRLEGGSGGTVIQGNRIGVDLGGTLARGNGASQSSSGIGLAGSFSGVTIGGTGIGQANTIANNGGAGVGFSNGGIGAITITGNRMQDNGHLGIRLNPTNLVLANDGLTDGTQANNGMDHPVFTTAAVADAGNAVTLAGYIGTGTGQALFAGARIEVFKAAADPSGYGEGQVYLGTLIADSTGRFSGTMAIAAGQLVVGDPITATATDGSGNTSEFGPARNSTTMAALSPAGFNAYETDTAAGAIAGPLRTRVAGVAGSVAVVALAPSGTALHVGFTGDVALTWLDARSDTAPAVGSCRASWLPLGSAGTASFTSANRVTVAITPPATSTRVMRLQMSWTNGGSTVTACSTDAFAVLPASLSLVVTDQDSATAGTLRALSNVGASGGTVHRAGRPFTLTAQARTATGTLMTGYDGRPVAGVTACLLPAGCSAGTLTTGSVAAASGTYVNALATYSEVGAIRLQLVDSTHADIDAADTAAAARRVASPEVNVGRFVPDSLELTVSTTGTLATANGACMASGQGSTFIDQPFGWATAPQVTVTARNAGGSVTSLWTGSLMKLVPAAATPTLQASATGSATLATSFGALTVTDLGGGRARLVANALDRFALQLPAGTVQATVTPSWLWRLAVSDGSESAVSGNPVLAASITQSPLPFDRGADFHSGRLALAAAHGDARAGVRSLVHLQRYSSAGWVTMTEDRGCVTVQRQNLGVESPTGVFTTAGDCAAPLSAAVTTGGGRAWLSLPATPGAAPGRLALRLAGEAATGHACTAAGASAPLQALGLPWLTGGAAASGPTAPATWGSPQRDPVLRRETW